MSGYVDYDRESGKCAYDVYSKAVYSKAGYSEATAKTGDKSPEWDQLSPEIQEAWIAAARAVRERESKRNTQF